MENKMYIVSDLDMGTILNVMTYEYYARLYRRLHRAQLNRRPYFKEYMDECKKYLDLESISEEAWRGGYEFIADLFDDNEANGTPCDEEALFQQNIMQTLNMCNKRRR